MTCLPNPPRRASSKSTSGSTTLTSEVTSDNVLVEGGWVFPFQSRREIAFSNRFRMIDYESPLVLLRTKTGDPMTCRPLRPPFDATAFPVRDGFKAVRNPIIFPL